MKSQLIPGKGSSTSGPGPTMGGNGAGGRPREVEGGELNEGRARVAGCWLLDPEFSIAGFGRDANFADGQELWFGRRGFSARRDVEDRFFIIVFFSRKFSTHHMQSGVIWGH